MSQVYSTEPATTGRVILETSHGPIDIKLWCKECPSTTRAFLQLCLDGYYDSVVFHRIMENFLIQAGQVKFRNGGGAAQDVATGDEMKRYLTEISTPADAPGDSDASSRRKLEVSPRIRFNHRGQVALALPLDEDTEGNTGADALRSQFFITLDESAFLDGKHVIFGTVVGPTVFNALRIGKVAVDEDSRPIDMDMSPPIINGVSIKENPFEDLVPTPDERVPWKKNNKRNSDVSGSSAAGESEVKKRRKKRKGKRDLNVLSFGEEMAEDMMADHDIPKRLKSSHDVLASDSKFLSSSIDHSVKEAATAGHVNDQTERKKKKSRKGDGEKGADDDIEIHEKYVAKAKQSSFEKKEEMIPGAREEARNRGLHKTEIPRADASAYAAKEKAKNFEPEKKVSAVEARRAKYLKGGSSRRGDIKKGKSKREADTLAKLSSFRSKVLHSKGKSGDENLGVGGKSGAVDNSLAARMAKRSMAAQGIEDSKDKVPTYHGQVLEDDNMGDANVSSSTAWMKSKFKCKKHIDHGTKKGTMDEERKGEDGRALDDYEIHDSKGTGAGDSAYDNDDRRPDHSRPHRKDHHHHHRRHRGHSGGGGARKGGVHNHRFTSAAI